MLLQLHYALHNPLPGLTDSHRLLRIEFLTAEAADAFAIVHHGPLVYHSNGLWQAAAHTGAAAVESLLVASLSSGGF
jgi:hypothetical protein